MTPTAPNTSVITVATSVARWRIRATAVVNAASTRVAEIAPVDRLVTIRLHGADLVQRFVDVGADVADAVLARARELADPAAEQDDRHDDDRHAGEHEQRELDARHRQHDEPAGEQQQVADRHRRARADHRVEHRGVVDEARDRIAGPRHLEEPGRQRQQVAEHRAAQIGGHALADPRHEVEARVGRRRHHDDDAEHQGERPVELACVAGGEPAIDDPFEALPDGEHRRRRDNEGDRRKDDLPPIRAHELADARERPERGNRTKQRFGLGVHRRNGDFRRVTTRLLWQNNAR